MDAVSDVLRVVSLGGAVFLNGEFTAPWCVATEADATFCAGYLPRAEQVASYHLVTAGSCWVQLADQPTSAMQLNAGELLVVPQGESHVMGSDLRLPSVATGPLLADQLSATPGEVLKICYGGGGESTRLICGFFACNETIGHPLLASLPRIFKVDMRDDPRTAWLESSLEFAAAESAEWRAGSTIVLSRLSELLFVEALRRCIDSLPPDQTGWLAGARDRFVGRALSLLHAQPARPWTVDELARKAGLSRSAMAQRFTDLIGQPPMQYLARWRLQVAAQSLAPARDSIATVASQVGYDSEAAFSRAFKREFGLPPANWRKRRAQRSEAAPLQ
jgi:AraC-like DNA-binding protein